MSEVQNDAVAVAVDNSLEAPATSGKKETQYETVKMDDGRIVDFAGTKRLLKSDETGSDGVVKVRFDFRNGETRLFTVPSQLLLKFAVHGVAQKLGDEVSGLKDIDDAVLAIDNLMDRLERGEWTQVREANGLAGTSVLARALVEVTGNDIKRVREYLSTKSQAEKIALRTNAKIAPVIARLEAGKTKKENSIDTDALLGELGGEVAQEAAGE